MMTKHIGVAAVIAGAMTLGSPAFAQRPAKAPANATAQCKDDSYSTAKTEQGACSKHGGVKTWFGAAASPAAPTNKAPASSPKVASAAPSDATGQCGDGSYTRAKTQSGACSKHGGVKAWFAKGSGARPTSNAAPAPSSRSLPPPPPPAATPRSVPAPAPSAPRSAPSSGKAPMVSPPAGTPANATAKCKDNSYSFAKSHSGACSSHGGVAEWYK
jgi:Protein of unknown function (DUF3761)